MAWNNKGFISCSRYISIEGQQGSLLHVVLSLGPRLTAPPSSETSLWEGKRGSGESGTDFGRAPLEMTRLTSMHISLAKEVSEEAQSHRRPRRGKTGKFVNGLHIYLSEDSRVWGLERMCTNWDSLGYKNRRWNSKYPKKREFIDSQNQKSGSDSVCLQAKLNPRVRSL